MSFLLIKRQNGQFLFGLCLGLSLTVVLQIYDTTTIVASRKGKRVATLRPDVSSDEQSKSQTTGDHGHMHDFIREQRFNYSHHHHDDDTIARQLYKDVRVVCWILTSPSNLDKKAVHVKNTWAKRCNIALFMSSVHNASFPTIGLNVTEGRKHLTAKTMKAFKYLYDNHIDDADWFIKADDDTYVIMENLRYFLSNENSQDPIYFGHRFKRYVKQGYPSGGGGYVLSKEALRRFGSEGANNPNLCAMDIGSAEDVQMGKCLQNLGIKLRPSVDAMQRTRFHCFRPETVLLSSFPGWYHSYDLEGTKGGIENISDYAISFHYISPDTMYALEFYTYHLQPYGVLNRLQMLNVKS